MKNKIFENVWSNLIHCQVEVASANLHFLFFQNRFSAELKIFIFSKWECRKLCLGLPHRILFIAV
jgi:hypothetical protein